VFLPLKAKSYFRYCPEVTCQTSITLLVEFAAKKKALLRSKLPVLQL
jgi:hypothetical protein